MMVPIDIKDIRKHNLQLLIKERAEGSTGIFAKQLGWEPSVVSAMKSGRSTISEKRILEMSNHFKLPYGWFDDNRLSSESDDHEPAANPPATVEKKKRGRKVAPPVTGRLSFEADGFLLDFETRGSSDTEAEITRLALRIIEIRSR